MDKDKLALNHRKELYITTIKKKNRGLEKKNKTGTNKQSNKQNSKFALSSKSSKAQTILNRLHSQYFRKMTTSKQCIMILTEKCFPNLTWWRNNAWKIFVADIHLLEKEIRYFIIKTKDIRGNAIILSESRNLSIWINRIRPTNVVLQTHRNSYRHPRN